MHYASVIACASQALMAGYVGLTLGHRAKTSARRVLARTMLFTSAYAVAHAAVYAVQAPAAANPLVALTVLLGGLGTIDLFGFAIWHARGADIAEPARLPTAARALATISISAFAVAYAFGDTFHLDIRWPALGELLVAAAMLVGASVAFAVSRVRRVPGARGYLFACLLAISPVLMNVAADFTSAIPWELYRPVRDVTFLLYEFMVLVSYLDDGHEPMSLRHRLVSAVLMATLAFTDVSAHVLLPVVVGPDGNLGAAAGQLVTIRLVVAAVVVTASVIALAPSVFRKSLLAPLDQLAVAISQAETGERVELVVDRKDELGLVMRSFNTMVSSLANGRAKLADRLVELETRQLEIETLNEELRRQVAARSRHLAQVLPHVERLGGAIQPGAVVDGRYIVEEELGAGAMGVVFGVRRLKDQKPLALKTIIGGSPDEAVRFTREAELAAMIDHPNIVLVMDVGIHQGAPYFVMERLSGGSLAAHSKRFGDLPWVLPILRQIAAGLEDLDARSIFHRDLKPANVLLDGDPEAPLAKISDLGIARANLADALMATAEAGSGERRLGETAPSALVGTFPYMAPELGRGALHYSSAAEVFSFGVLAWEVATGTLPFRVPPVFTVLSGEPMPDPSAFAIAHPLEGMLRRCLSRSPDARPPIGEIVRALRQYPLTSPSEKAAVGV